MDERIMTLHPDNKQGTHISREKYETIRDAILSVLDEHGDVTFTQLTQAVQNRVGRQFDGSVGWYVTTVKLDLEARKLIERVTASRPQRLRRLH